MFGHVNPKMVFAVAAVAFLAGARPMFAQQTLQGSLQGVVNNSSGAPVSGAFVKLKNDERRLTFMVITQAQGRYTAKNLPPGKYVAQGIGNGFQSEWSAAADVEAGQPATVNLSLTAPQAPMLPAAWPGRQPGQAGGGAGRAYPPAGRAGQDHH